MVFDTIEKVADSKTVSQRIVVQDRCLIHLMQQKQLTAENINSELIIYH